MTLQYWISKTLIAFFARTLFRWKVIGQQNIPEGGALIASNHLSNYDPPLIGGAIKRDLFYFAKIELFKNRLFGALIRSVNAFPVRRGEADLEAWKTSRAILKSGKLLLFFPEGTRSLDGEVQAAKPGMARLAFAAGVPVVPAAISGSNSLKDVFFRRSKLRVGFAQPVSIEQFGEQEGDGKGKLDRLTEAVMSEIKRLKREVETA